ncbi:MAG: hypothetical protein KAU95_04485, partial [Candidatus Aenigmarchaeota archaeon]|nr:hypothetical protein [Candidatus Aenigmarchaeota archaeon]
MDRITNRDPSYKTLKKDKKDIDRLYDGFLKIDYNINLVRRMNDIYTLYDKLFKSLKHKK